MGSGLSVRQGLPWLLAGAGAGCLVTALALQQPQQASAVAPFRPGSTSSVVAIVGSAFSTGKSGTLFVPGYKVSPLKIATPWGLVEVYRLIMSGIDGPSDRELYLLPRHGIPHRFLPHQIQYRAQCAALRALNCKALLVSSSVGLLDDRLPQCTPFVISDIIMPENRLPCGGPCTMFAPPTHSDVGRRLGPDLRPADSKRAQDWVGGADGHLVLSGASGMLQTDLSRLAHESVTRAAPSTVASTAAASGVVFAYVPGPRTKTPAENAAWSRLGAQVNSMTVGPELVLAAEVGIPAAAIVIGHKRSKPSDSKPSKTPATATPGREAMAASLTDGRDVLQTAILDWLHRVPLDCVPSSYVYRL